MSSANRTPYNPAESLPTAPGVNLPNPSKRRKVSGTSTQAEPGTVSVLRKRVSKEEALRQAILRTG